jgi:hypothetical protein
MGDPADLQKSCNAEWSIALATVVLCRENFLPGGADETLHTTYTVIYEYEVQGRKYQGKYKRDSPVDPGHQFEVAYDPQRPDRNTGAENQPQSTVSIIFGMVLGTVLILLFLYFKYVD